MKKQGVSQSLQHMVGRSGTPLQPLLTSPVTPTCKAPCTCSKYPSTQVACSFMDPLDLRLGALQSRHTRRQVKASCLLSNSIKQRCPSFGPDLWELRSPTPLQCRWVTNSDERHPRFRRQPICFPAPRERPSLAAWNAQGRALRYRNTLFMVPQIVQVFCIWHEYAMLGA